MVATADLRRNYVELIAAAVLAVAFAIRWRLAGWTYFNLDEAYQAWLSGPGFPQLWHNMLEPTQPPLLIFLLHWIRKLGQSEYVFRLIPVACGVLFPWFVFRWTGLIWSRAAGFVALVILSCSPLLVHLSSVVRCYTLALFWLAAALYALEWTLRAETKTPAGALMSPQTRWMLAYCASLVLAALSSYAVSFFVGALGVYVLLHWRDPGFSRPAKAVWIGTQLTLAAIYVFLLFHRVLPLRADHQPLVNDPNSYFGKVFPQAGQPALDFIWQATFGTFHLVFDWRLAAWAALGAFLAALALLWMAEKRRLLVVFLVPFVLACTAAFLKTYPYGKSRQSILLAVPIAVAAGIAADWLLRRRTALVTLAALAFVPLCSWAGPVSPFTVKPAMRRAVMQEVIHYIHQNVPRGSRILTERPTILKLNHYLDPHARAWPRKVDRGESDVNGYLLYGPFDHWQDWEQVWAFLDRWTASHSIPPDETVWILDMAYGCPLCGAQLLEKNLGPHARQAVHWGSVAVIAPVPAGYRPSKDAVESKNESARESGGRR